MKKKVCVIGAGASGLVSLKELVAEGHDVSCFEKASSFGGAFSGPGVEANRVYESLYLTISNYYMAFSDFPPRGDWKFWTGAEYLEYMPSYAQEFDLLRHVTFSTAVTQVVEVKRFSVPFCDVFFF
jgi:cation diffusion facilitator CzcD-associated flavoprotein CzcO